MCVSVCVCVCVMLHNVSLPCRCGAVIERKGVRIEYLRIKYFLMQPAESDINSELSDMSLFLLAFPLCLLAFPLCLIMLLP